MKKYWLYFIALAFLTSCQPHTSKLEPDLTQNRTLSVESDIVLSTLSWDDITRHFMLNIPENDRIKQAKLNFLKQSHYIEIVLQNAEPYLPFIIQELRKNKMPIELSLLPFIESNYVIKPVRQGRAAGLWQIMPVTGRVLNLKQTKQYDARLDMQASTIAAISLLNTLNKEFNGDWLLTLAAYNAGGGKVRQAIKQNKQRNLATDYWALSLPQETMNYVPKFLAIVNLIKQNKNNSITLPEINLENQLISLKLNQKTSIDSLAQTLKLNKQILMQNNPALLSNVIDHKITLYIKQNEFRLPKNNNLDSLLTISEPITVDLIKKKSISSVKITNKIYNPEIEKNKIKVIMNNDSSK